MPRHWQSSRIRLTGSSVLTKLRPPKTDCANYFLCLTNLSCIKDEHSQMIGKFGPCEPARSSLSHIRRPIDGLRTGTYSDRLPHPDIWKYSLKTRQRLDMESLVGFQLRMSLAVWLAFTPPVLPRSCPSQRLYMMTVKSRENDDQRQSPGQPKHIKHEDQLEPSQPEAVFVHFSCDPKGGRLH